MDIKLIISVILGVFLSIYGLYLLYNMPFKIMKNMEAEVKECIDRKNREYEERQKSIKDLRKWLFR